MATAGVSFLKIVRLTHLYLGVFIAPALLFFAFTGALQTFSLHETTKGSNYQPPRWAMVLGQLHKKQTVELSAPKNQAPTAKVLNVSPPSQSATTSTSAPQPKHNLLPMKYFFLLVAVGLFTSTLTGLYMSYKYARGKLGVTLSLAAGIAIPLLLLLL
jgi:hypothetical protein